MTIHLLGSDGFVGRAIQRHVPPTFNLHCWSHRSSCPHHYFDLLDSTTWLPLLDSHPSHVILLSWPGLPNYNESFHITTNLVACINLIDQLVLAGVERLLVAGTCYEYGLQNGCLTESQFTDPVTCYSIAKDSLRRYINTRYSNCNLQWCWARIFYSYGFGQNPNSLLPSLLKALNDGDKSFPMGSGRQIRDFIDVDVVASHLLKLITHENAYGIYNIGSGVARSVSEFVEGTVSSSGTNILLEKGVYPDRLDEPIAFWAEMSKFNSL